MSDDCPTAEELRRYLTGEPALDPETHERVEVHLEVCGPCQAAIDRPIGAFSDDPLSPAKGARPAPDERDEAALEQIRRSPPPEGSRLTPPGETVTFLPGTRIGYKGDYELLEEIGRGAMGVVYRARQESLRRIVALKMILAAQFASKSTVDRFLIEAEAAAELQHPNIVPIHEVGKHEGLHYFSMDLIDGSNLEEWNNKEDLGRLTQREAATLVAKVARAVHAAHQRGVIHRDLKPANILIDARGEPHITDFGLAKRVGTDSGLSQSGVIIGTPCYMAPEQAGGKIREITTAVDVYGLGAVLYDLITGKPPFEGPTLLETVRLVREAEPKKPRAFDAKIERDLETICLKCLEKDPGRRYGTAEALAEDLERWLRGEPIVARRSSAWERTVKWARRKPAIAALGGALLATGLLGGVLILWKWHEASVNLDRVNEANRELAFKTREASQKLADFYLERGRLLAEKGELSGLLWMARAVATAPNDDAARQHMIRLCISVWSRQLNTLTADFTINFEMNIVTGPFLSPDSKFVVTMHKDSTARIWSLASGEPVGKPLGGGAGHEITAVAFSPGGKTLATAHMNSTVRLWNLATGGPIGEYGLHQGRITKITFSPDSKTLATRDEGNTVRLWRSDSGEPIGEPLEGKINGEAFGPDGKGLVTWHDDNTVRLWKVDGGTSVGRPMPHQGQVVDARLSPDGAIVITRDSDDVSRLWNAVDGTLRESRGGYSVTRESKDTLRLRNPANSAAIGPAMVHHGEIRSEGVSLDGTTLMTRDGKRVVRLWSMVDGSPIGNPIVHQNEILKVALSYDSKSVMSLSYIMKKTREDPRKEELVMNIRVWKITDGSLLRNPLYWYDTLVSSVNADGKSLIVAYEKTARLISTAGGSSFGRPLVHQDNITAVAFSPDGKTILTGSEDRTARLWNAADGTPIGQPMTHQDSVRDVAFSPDGKTILTGSEDRTARLWNAADGTPIGQPMTHSDAVHSVMFSPDGETLATREVPRYGEPTVRLWKSDGGVSIGKPIGDVRLRDLTGSFSPDGKTLATGHSRSVRLWSAASGEAIGEYKLNQNGIIAVAFSPDGRTLATGSGDKTSQLWNAVDLTPIGEPMMHQDAVWAVAFSPDGRILATGTRNYLISRELSAPMHSTLCLWSTVDCTPVGMPQSQRPSIWHMAYSHDGKMMLIQSDDGSCLSQAPAPIVGDPKQVVMWAQRITGMELIDKGDVIRFLDPEDRVKRRQRLVEVAEPTP